MIYDIDQHNLGSEMESLLKLADAAATMGVAEHTLRAWRAQGRGPEGFKVGRRVMYRREVVAAWLAEQEAATSSNTSRPQGSADA